MDRLATQSNVNRRVEIGLHEYEIVVQPDAVLSEKILTERISFSSKYFSQRPIKSLPVITMASFVAREEMEETIIRYTQRICSKHASFNVELNNYSSFPSGQIFLRIQNPQPFKILSKELDVINSYVKSCFCPAVRMIAHPHIQITKQLANDTYLKAMMDYSQKTFHEIFMVNELILLRRNHPYDVAKTVQVFRLQPPGFTAYGNS